MYRIRQLREDKKISQRALAEKIGVSFKAVNFWEQGKVEPSAKYICDYLLGREDDFGNVNVMRELSEQEKLWLGLLSKLKPSQRVSVIDYINYLISKM